ncbi:hypothetical protein Tco_0163823 [Tanacetum coccineum]
MSRFRFGFVLFCDQRARGIRSIYSSVAPVRKIIKVLRRKRCWKTCFTFLGGAFGTSGTNSFLRLLFPERMLFSTILFYALFIARVPTLSDLIASSSDLATASRLSISWVMESHGAASLNVWSKEIRLQEKATICFDMMPSPFLTNDKKKVMKERSGVPDTDELT